MITLHGHVESIKYYNKENHYTIAGFRTDRIQNSFTIVGYLACINPGESLKISGAWEKHPKYGQQFKVDGFEVTLPSTVHGIKKYLRSGIIKGIGGIMSDRLVSRFQEDTFEIIEKFPERLVEVEGIGDARASLICNAWRNHHIVRTLMQFLQDNRVNPAFGAKIIREYGSSALDIIKSNPYRMTKDIPGIDFFVVDTIAERLNVPGDAPERIMACIRYLTERASSEGDMFVFKEKLITRCSKLLNVDKKIIVDILKEPGDIGEFIVEEAPFDSGVEIVYARHLYEAENGIAQRLKAFLSIPVMALPPDNDEITANILKKLAVKLSGEQMTVLREIFIHRIVIITGGPGTGKTTLIRAVATIFETFGKQIFLTAPTGRAARRLSEVTGRKAATIHKLLGYNQTTGFFEKNRDNPIDSDVLIVDEASMVDSLLMFHLIHAVPMNSVMVMVGDVFQLPSVGPGNVLSDMIESKKIRTFELKNIYRQSKESPIIINAHKVCRGEQPDFNDKNSYGKLSEFYFIEREKPVDAVETIVELCADRIPEKFKLDHLDDIQVLTPMHKGEVGTINLNHDLQEALNTNILSVESKGRIFKIGDKVMHLKNNYQKDVFNGDIGIISSVDTKQKKLSVDYYGRIVEYDTDEMDELSLAYAITVHKSQGSEYPAVIIPLMTQHFPLLQRNLLYTAITRGKKLVILIGTKKALNIALKNDKPRKRLSGLAARLAG